MTTATSVRSLYDSIKAHGQHDPASIAILAPDRAPLSYGRLRQQIDDVVRHLHNLCLGPNDRIGLILPNGAEIAVAVLGVLTGACCVPLNAAQTKDEFEYLFSKLHLHALITGFGVDTPGRGVAERLGIRILELVTGRDPEAGLFTFTETPPRRSSRPTFAAAEDVALVLHTSGTTARPKIVPLTQANICASAQNIVASLHLTRNDRCINVLPLFHVHGLIGALFSSLTAGGSVICCERFDSSVFFSCLETLAPTWYTAVPTIHQTIAGSAPAHRDAIARCRLRFVRSSSSPLPPQVAAALEGLVSAPVINSYGMTEASHQIASNPLPPGQRKPGSVGRAVGTEVGIIDAKGQMLPAGETGEIVVRGPTIIRGYESAPGSEPVFTADGWFRTGDQGHCDAEGYLFITGRLKEIVNRGGEKIAPLEVDDALTKHPDVAQAVAFPVAHEQLGQDLVAAVVLKPDASSTGLELRAFARKRLAEHKVPSRILIVDEIPKGATGKLDRNGLAKHWTAGLRAAFAPPQSPTEKTLCGIWENILGVARVGIHDNFFELGGQSLLATQVISRVHETFEIDAPLRILFEAPTISGLADTIDTMQRLTQIPSGKPKPDHDDDEEATFSGPTYDWYDKTQGEAGNGPRSGQGFSCVLVGEGSLLIPCAEILVQQGCHLLGIVSANSDVLAWASQRDLLCTGADAALARFMEGVPFDYLFSIVNPFILSEAILALPRKGAINYHDGPLPRYAGVHATSWAVINQESTHAVTWHWMTPRVDEGAILCQPSTDIDAAETTHTLNAKCYELALRSFADLVPQLVTGAVSSRKQDLSQRTYYAKRKTPRGACVLLWSQPADRIAALVRGLSFGPFDNALGLPKLVIEGDILIVPDLTVTESHSRERPGTITAIGSDFIQVATQSHDVMIRELTPVNGKHASIGELARHYDLRRGTVLPEPDETTIGHLTELSGATHPHESFWLRRLSDLIPLEIPCPRRDRTVEPPTFTTVPIPIPEEVGKFAIAQGLGPADFVIGTFAIFLARLSDSWTFDLGLTHPDLQREVGRHENLFVTRVPLRVTLSSRAALATALASIRSQMELVIQHKTYARDMVFRFSALSAIRARNAQSLLPVNVALVETLIDHPPASESLLTLIIETRTGRCHWAFNTSRLDANAMARMHRRFATFVGGMVSGGRQRLDTIPLITAAERQQLVVEWNDTSQAYPRSSVHELFEKQAEKTPDAIAVVQATPTSGDSNGDTQITYRELNVRANQLAHYLRRLGVVSEVLVGVCMDRSVEMIIGLLGILKAGGAYVPLDPSYPKERLEFMIQDSALGVILTDSEPDLALESRAPMVVRLDHHWRSIGQESGNNPASDDSSDRLAYVIYTSGSSGRPKGVAIPHRGVARLLFGADYVRFGADQCFLLISSVSFDVAVWELWGALLHGARSVLFPNCLPSPDLVHNVIREQAVDSLLLVTPLFNVIIDEAPEALTEVRQLLIGGEALSAPHAFRGLQHLAATHLINAYGPTESTVFATAYPIPADIDRTWSSIPIGRPIANTTVYILDRCLNPCPIDVSGQIFLGGPGLARGYLNQAWLSAQAFLPDPWGNAGSRLYTTGDRARILSDGNIDFQERLDHQVKIRGFRIELGEIEAVLVGHPGVQEAVVMARNAPTEHRRPGLGDDSKLDTQHPIPNTQYLVAYVVGGAATSPRVDHMRQHLRQELPEYMVPQAFVVLDQLPLSPNGKIDRRALPDPARSRPETAAVYVAPRTPTEELLAGAFAELLGVEPVGVLDNFFDLGGHSLLATRVISRVNEAFDVTVALRELFEAPTVAKLADRVAAALAGERSAQPQPLRPVVGDADHPLSFAQQRLWFLDQLAPESWAYNVFNCLRWRGPLRASVLEACLEEIVRRHETLRTRIVATDGIPIQVIAPQSEHVLRQADFRALSEGAREALIEKLIEEELHRPFDLSRGVLLRVTLFQVGEEEYIWLITMHHIVSDGWSMGVFWRELMALYGAFSQGRASPLPELPAQYVDFSLWQREWLQGTVREEQLSYWKEELAGAPAVLDLPTDRQRPVRQTFEGGQRMVVFPGALHRSLKKLCQEQGATLFMTLLGAFEILLCRYTAQEDFVVGSPIANRNRSEIEDLIGFFVNMICVRADVSGDPAFSELLVRIRERTLRAYAHQDSPFEQLVEQLGGQRDVSRTPLFQVAFALQNAPQSALELPGVSLTPVRLKSVPVRYDLELHMWEAPEGLTANLIYNTDLFNAETIERMLSHYGMLLEGIVSNPDGPVSRLPLLTDTERQQLLVEWNDTARGYPTEQWAHELFETQVEWTPEAVAVAFPAARSGPAPAPGSAHGEEGQLTYRELNQRANQLAHYLRALGVGPEVLVGIMMERSVEMVVGLLGILKTGGAYIPLDPDYPRERLEFMVQDSGMSVLLTQSWLQERQTGHLQLSADGHSSVAGRRSPVGSGEARRPTLKTQSRTPRTVLLDNQQPTIAQENVENLSVQLTGDNLAYVIYTSGSTGQPKGVAMRHRTLHNLIAWQHEQLPDRARTLQFASLSFDVSLQESLSTWASGGTLVVIPEAMRRNIAELSGLLADEQIERMFVPGVVLQALAQSAMERSSDLRTLREVVTAGEQLQITAPIAEWFAQSASCALHNHYGPSETHVVTAFRLPSPISERSNLPPIGRPITNIRIYVVNHRLWPTPVGVPGELLIGGMGLARGYQNRPELTADTFIPDSFGAACGSRVYRTGDIARYQPDGNLLFLGRRDHQVKIRGFRIELGEIKAVLVEHPGVQEAIVVAQSVASEDGRPGLGDDPKLDTQHPIPNPQYLVAYVVGEAGTSPRVDQMRQHLRQKLPEHMVPQAFVVLDRLPLTLTGKVDRKALPKLDRLGPDLEQAGVNPRTETEERLAAIWIEILGLEQVSVHDNFFDLGGHSLLAAQMLSRVRGIFAIDPPLHILFETPTIAGLANFIDTIHWATESPGPVPLASDDEMENATF